MPGLSELVRRLAEQRTRWTPTVPTASRLREVGRFGSNPGRLRMYDYVPQIRPDRPALVVVLHGCTQTAAGYDEAAGWSRLADQDGFVLLFPEQQQQNNPKGCFNWFLPEHTTRGRGEAASIRQMIACAVEQHDIDPARIYITGLSAGGAMAAALLAVYPEVFAGGAVIAGLPFGAAVDVQSAFKAMFNGTARPPHVWGDLVRDAAPAPSRWPRVEIWHGTADHTVKPLNSDELTKQWTNVHGINPAAVESTLVDGLTRRHFRAADGTIRVTQVLVPGLGHGAPIDTAVGAPGRGKAAPFMLEAGISSTYQIARSFELSPERMRPADATSEAVRPAVLEPQEHAAADRSAVILGVITAALRKGGLLRA